MPHRTFRLIFLAVVFATALIVLAFMINHERPGVETAQPSAMYVMATGKCVECHIRETPAIVYEYETSHHAAKGVSCLDCHQPMPGQEKEDHRGFVISKQLTAQNCQQCHRTEYEQYLRSRHAAPAWAAVAGTKDFTPAQIAFFEQFHKGAVNRAAHPLVAVEGSAAAVKGCYMCHSVGRPNSDGTIGTCTACHARHASSVSLARLPSTCGQCHMGPDHSQVEIYDESKHGVLFAAQREHMNLEADPHHLTAKDMPVPTCATCHMSGLGGQHFTHDVTERLSYWLFAAVSERRPNYLLGQANMQEICLNCHTKPKIDQFYKEAETVVASTNDLVKQSQQIIQQLRDEHLVAPGSAFSQRLDYLAFDLWHYYGRTAKHGAFMGGADFVQWHGYYEIVRHLTEIKEISEQLHRDKAATTQPSSDHAAAP